MQGIAAWLPDYIKMWKVETEGVKNVENWNEGEDIAESRNLGDKIIVKSVN